MIKENYLTYVHHLRGLAILIIVAIHSRMALFGNSDIAINKGLVVFLDNGTIIFVFISGFLFHHVFIPRFDYKNYLIKKSKYVLLPYLLVSIPPILDKLYFDNNIPWLTTSLQAKGPVEFVAYMLLTGKHFGPFWFIPMITVFYIISPALIKLNTRVFYVYFFPLIFILGLFTYQFGYYSTIINSFVFYLPIYLLGMIVSQYKEFLFRNQVWFLTILTLIYALILVLELNGSLVTPRLTDFNNSNLKYFVFDPAKLRFSLLAVLLTLVFHNIMNAKLRFLQLLGDYSFGIYFIHLFFIIIFQKIIGYYHINLPMNIISFVLMLFFTLLFSVLFVWIVKIFFGSKSRYIIGS
ncbi:MAG: acyltransferase [Cyclobacteriaceae bacterium]|nr:acyltransferase [Cyclobacteriaceae bacterium]